MKAITLAALLSLSGLALPWSADPQPKQEPKLVVRVTSATPGREVAVEGYYLFRLGAPQDVRGVTPMTFSAHSERVLAVLHSTQEGERIQVELLREEGRSNRLVAASGQFVKLSKEEVVGSPYQVLAY